MARYNMDPHFSCLPMTMFSSHLKSMVWVSMIVCSPIIVLITRKVESLKHTHNLSVIIMDIICFRWVKRPICGTTIGERSLQMNDE